MRKTIEINNDWKFIKEDKEESINLPHTWNAIDGQDGGNDYYRGTCSYKKELNIPDHNKTDRIYLEFLGAANTADVYINGNLVAHHEGGYSTFRVDVTDYIKEENTLCVKLDNKNNDTVYPQTADFTFYGGLYRSVNLIIVPEVHFDLDYFGSKGIKVTPIVLENSAMVEVEIYTTKSAKKAFITVNNKIQKVEIIEGYAKTVFEIKDVHLWNGIQDPFLYTAIAELESGDVVETKFGCRYFKIDSNKGFILNGKEYPLRGVSRHQDTKGKGNALSLEDHIKDMEMIKEIGANTIRLAHYQHSQEFYDLCDEAGMVVWAEIPYITRHMINGRENTISQMKELVVQNYNHPSIVVWGLSNEITAASPVDDDLTENHKILNDICHSLDKTRLTTLAHAFMLETDSPIIDIPDINSYNLYFGWYLGELSQNDEFFDEFHEKYPNKPIGFSEYGADANPSFQSSKPERGDYTETYQALYHEHMINMINKRPYLWATHVWNMFDFAADGRDEGGKHGENQKGLVTMDRKIKKDAFYLYKAHWNKTENFIHIAGRRYKERCEDNTNIKVYSNLSTITLYVDGVEVETKTAKAVFDFTISLTGKHTITAKSNDFSDSIEIVKVDKPNQDYSFSKKGDVVNWFDSEEIDPEYYSINDTLGEVAKNEKANTLVQAIIQKARDARGDVAKAVNNKANPAMEKIMARMTFSSMIKQIGDAVPKEKILDLNRVLQSIKK